MTDERNIASDARLLTRAIRQRWPIAANVRQAAVARMTKVLIDPEASHRDSAAAVRALTAMEAQNQSDEHASGMLDPSVGDTEFDAQDQPVSLQMSQCDISELSDDELRNRIRRLQSAAVTAAAGGAGIEAEEAGRSQR